MCLQNDLGVVENRDEGWVFSNTLIKSPKMVTHKIFGFLQRWKKMARKEEVKTLEDLTEKMKGGLLAALVNTKTVRS